MITAGLLDRVLPALRPRVPVLAADVSGKQGNLLRFKDVDLLCPTEREVREAQHDFASGLGAVVWNLLNATRRPAGDRHARQAGAGHVRPRRTAPPTTGCAASTSPPCPTACVDPLGCGDALLATASLALAAGGSLQAAAFLGSIAAAVEVQQVGNQPVDAEQILAQLHGPRVRRRCRVSASASVAAHEQLAGTPIGGSSRTSLARDRVSRARYRAGRGPGLRRDLAELLLVAADELLQRRRQPLHVRVAHDHAVGHLEQQLLLPALRVGVGHVEAEVETTSSAVVWMR